MKMKKVLLTLPLLLSGPVLASQCKVDIKNEIHLDGEAVEIYQKGGDTAIVDANNNLQIAGENVALTTEQKQLLSDYRESLNAYIPRVKQMAQDGLELANNVIDDVAVSFDAPGAFDNVKDSMKKFYEDVESRYYKNGDFILPVDGVSSMADTWTQDLEKAGELFNEEFVISAFNAMSEKMKAEGGINLTQMANSMTELKERVSQSIAEHEKDVIEQGQEFCDSLGDMADQEQKLHQKIPELKDYQVFTI